MTNISHIKMTTYTTLKRILFGSLVLTHWY